MAFKIDMDDLKARAKARASGQQTAQPEPWLMAKPANVAKTANETPEVLAKLAGLATLAISQQPREGVTTSPPKSGSCPSMIGCKPSAGEGLSGLGTLTRWVKQDARRWQRA